jgi:hypothetical protein
MSQNEAIREALKYLQTGKALDVVRAIEILHKALVMPKQCQSCISPMECEFNDRCQKGLTKER